MSIDFGGVSEVEFLKALKISINYSDLLYRLNINRNEYLMFYNHFMKGGGKDKISYDLRGYLKDIDVGKIVENNYKYMVARQYEDLKSLDISDKIDENILISKALKLSSFKEYQISNEEIVQRAKALGIIVVSEDDILDETRINIIKSCPIKNPTLYQLKLYLKPYDDIFDISIGHIVWLCNKSDIKLIY